MVVDASVVVAGLVDGGSDGRWAEGILADQPLAAPHLLAVEVTDVLRRAALADRLSNDVASLAHRDLGLLRIETFAYHPFADRVWELRGNVTAYDAWYVALAERLGVPLATLDRRLSRAPGPTCQFMVPPRTA